MLTSEQKQQKLSEIKAGLDDADVLVKISNVTYISWLWFLFIDIIFSFVFISLLSLTLSSPDSENGP